MPDDFVDSFADWLQEQTPFRAELARQGRTPSPGTVYVAPPCRHLGCDGERVWIQPEPADRLHRPSADILFSALAAAHGPAAVGVLLTGMGEDGAQGLLELRRAGGHTIVEDETTAAVFGMPKAALERGAAAESLPLNAIGPRLKILIAEMGSKTA